MGNAEMDVVKTEIFIDVQAMYPEIKVWPGTSVHLVETADGFLLEFDAVSTEAQGLLNFKRALCILSVELELDDDGYLVGLRRGGDVATAVAR